jgi:hypothetical protein
MHFLNQLTFRRARRQQVPLGVVGRVVRRVAGVDVAWTVHVDVVNWNGKQKTIKLQIGLKIWSRSYQTLYFCLVFLAKLKK